MSLNILKVKKWEEPIVENFSKENSINIAHAEYKISGELNGIIKSVYVIHYSKYDKDNLELSESTFTGYSHFFGSIGKEVGSFVFEEYGECTEKGLFSKMKIIPNSGDGELINTKGVANYTFENEQFVLEFIKGQ